MYVKAANLFKMAKKWNEAGNAFVKSAEINLNKGDAKHDAASNYADAATCFRKTNPPAAVDCLLKTAEIYTDMVFFVFKKSFVKRTNFQNSGSFYNGRKASYVHRRIVRN